MDGSASNTPQRQWEAEEWSDGMLSLGDHAYVSFTVSFWWLHIKGEEWVDK